MLNLTARGGHELACGSCGAPLHEMKALKAPAKRKSKSGKHGYGGAPVALSRPTPERKRRKKKRKPLWKKALGEAADIIEDIFD